MELLFIRSFGQWTSGDHKPTQSPMLQDSTTESETTTPPDDSPALTVRVQRARLLVGTWLVGIVVVVLAIVFHHGVSLRKFNATDTDGKKKVKLLDDYNSYSANVASVFGRPIEIIVGLVVQVMALRFATLMLLQVETKRRLRAEPVQPVMSATDLSFAATLNSSVTNATNVTTASANLRNDIFGFKGKEGESEVVSVVERMGLRPPETADKSTQREWFLRQARTFLANSTFAGDNDFMGILTSFEFSHVNLSSNIAFDAITMEISVDAANGSTYVDFESTKPCGPWPGVCLSNVPQYDAVLDDAISSVAAFSVCLNEAMQDEEMIYRVPIKGNSTDMRPECNDISNSSLLVFAIGNRLVAESLPERVDKKPPVTVKVGIDQDGMLSGRATNALLPHNAKIFEWDESHVQEGENCLAWVEDRLNAILENHFYIEHGLQTAYTAAMFFVFQDGVVCDVIPLSRDRESLDLGMNIRETSLFLSIPEQNVIMTISGVVLLCLGAVAVVVYSEYMARRPEFDPLSNIRTPHMIAQVLFDEGKFPPMVLHRRLASSSEREGYQVMIGDSLVDSMALRSRAQQVERLIELQEATSNPNHKQIV
ncbi:hypothetical protein Poli38472_003591 [Pythium oligandrum]|uniref:Uncharacterized protein n=1 Tax=Pythium oligandrum TaxID=41045 RepID=A0A8K1CLH3_PYTOL|nr:hypothetical protein Poli38472_003591 [Pythium oligandrum]|eukprot:TMW65826.1 hypothetical protein Poli38472_003591 [Pythium oligandrum]